MTRRILTGNTGTPDMFQAIEAATRCECERCGQDWSSKTVHVQSAHVTLQLCAWCSELPMSQHERELGQ